MTLEEFKACNPDLSEKLERALKSAAQQIGGIDGMKKLVWFCSNADQNIAEGAEEQGLV